jgi:acetyl esterase/lipase
VPFGYLISVVVLAVCTLAALLPVRRRDTLGASWSYTLGFLVNEVPAVGLAWLAAGTGLTAAQGDIDTPVGVIALCLALLTAADLVFILWRALPARRVLSRALGEPLPRRSLMSTVLMPWPRLPASIERIADVSYGEAGERNLLDVYVRRARPSDAPVLIYFHGGSFRSGHKHREGRPLLHHLAEAGWVCISANYRLSPAVTFPEHLIDVKRVIAWVREHGHDYGADVSTVLVAGSSAGGHQAVMAALTPNRPELQPGFEQVDTSVVAAVAIYGYFGTVRTSGLSSSPFDYPADDAPPMLVVHGDLDTVVPVEDARGFVDKLRSESSRAVVYAELPGAQHGFDVARSIRSTAFVDAVEAFAVSVGVRGKVG